MRVALTLFIAGCIALACTSAFAHGDPPEGLEVYAVDDGWIYMTNFGVISSAWPTRYVCEEAFFASDTYQVAPSALHRWATFSKGLASHTTDGCHFEGHTPIDNAPNSLAIRPNSDDVAALIRDDGASVLWHSDDGGIQWQPVGVDLDGIYASDVGFLDAGTVFILGYRTDAATRGEAILWSVDVASGHREPWEIGEGLNYPELLDANPGELLWHARRDGVTEVYWSDAEHWDAGHFEAPGWPTSGALSADGEYAYLGGVDGQGRGIFRATRQTRSTWNEVVADHRALCMATWGDQLLVCGHRRDDDHDLARWDPDQGLEPLLDFRDLEGPRSDCGADSRVERVCPPVWPELARALDIEVDAVDPTPAESDSENGSGCTTAATGFPAHIWWLIVGLFIARCGLQSRDSRTTEPAPALPPHRDPTVDW